MNTRIKKFAISALAIGTLAAGISGTASAGVFFYYHAPVVVAPVYVPVCRVVSVPVVNPYTGWSYFVSRTVCN